MNIAFQFPKCVIIIGMFHDAGFCDVPEARSMRNMLAGFMSTMFIPDIECPACGSSCAGAIEMKRAAARSGMNGFKIFLLFGNQLASGKGSDSKDELAGWRRR